MLGTNKVVVVVVVVVVLHITVTLYENLVALTSN